MSCCNTSKLSDRICETSGLDNVPLKGKKERKNNALQKSLGLTSYPMLRMNAGGKKERRKQIIICKSVCLFLISLNILSGRMSIKTSMPFSVFVPILKCKNDPLMIFASHNPHVSFWVD